MSARPQATEGPRPKTTVFSLADKRRRGERERGGDQQAGYPVNEPHARNLRPKRTLFKSAMRRRG